MERLRSHLIELQDSNTEELLTLQDEVDSLKNENIKLSQQASDPRNDKSTLQLENKTLTEKLERLSRELEDSKLSNTNLQSVLESIETEKASESEILLLEWKRKAREDSATIEMLRNENSELKVGNEYFVLILRTIKFIGAFSESKCRRCHFSKVKE